MPLLPAKKFPEIMENLNKKGYKKEVNYENLKLELMRVIGTVNDESIKRYISAMEEMKYIRKVKEKIWMIEKQL